MVEVHRFFIPREWISQGSVRIEGSLVHQLRDVLRLKAGDRIVVLDSSGWEYETELRHLTREGVAGEVVDRNLSPGEPRLRIVLCQALLKGRKFEWVLQKGTELGVASFLPIVCERCMVSQAQAKDDGKLARWERIVREAAEQSRRGKLPELLPAAPFPQVCESVTGLSLLPWEGETSLGIKEALQASKSGGGIPDSVNILIGPEGGFTSEEVGFASSHGILPVTLGKRVLRAESAGLVAAAAIFYEYGELGG